MPDMLALVSLAALCLTTIWYFVVVCRGKRPDLPWGRFFLVGPLIAVHPERYVTAAAARQVPALVLLWLLLFVVTAVLAAVADL